MIEEIMVGPMMKPPPVSPQRVEKFVACIFEEDLHAKRVLSLANGTLGVLHAGALCVHAIGRGLAAANGKHDKHTTKQVDRLLSNAGVDAWGLAEKWVPYVIAGRPEIVVNLDWTEFDPDDHSMLVASAQTKHGRSTPLLWKTVKKSELKGKRNQHEDELLLRLGDVVPDSVKVTVVADRGFGDQKLFALLEEVLGFEYIIRLRSVIHVTSAKGETRKAKEWVGKGGRMRVLRGARVTAEQHPVATVVCVKDKGMKDAWCLAVSDAAVTGQDAKKRYGKRFSCEETFRDVKDWRFGMGMYWFPIGVPERRDRMFLIAVLALALLTLLGEAGERAGLDRMLKTNTSKKRTLSLVRQGLRWYDLIPNMPEERLRILMSSFAEVAAEHEVFRGLLGTL